MYNVNPCWFILYQSQFNNYALQLYTVQKCIMSTLVGLFYAKISLTIMVSNYIQYKIILLALVGLFYSKVSSTIMVSNYIQYKNVLCQPLLGYFMPKSVQQLWSPMIYSTKMYYVNSCWVILCQSQFNNYGLQLYTIQKCIMSTLVGLFYAKVSSTIMVSNDIQ